MKKLLLVCVVLLTLSQCKKAEVVPQSKTKPTSCDFSISQFSMTKRTHERPITVFNSSLRKKPKPPHPTPPTFKWPVLYIDFDGETISNTSWNWSGDMTLLPSGLDSIEQQKVFDIIEAAYAPYKVEVTTDSNLYKRADPLRRQRLIITESWEWYGLAGGVAYINSMGWGDDTPCFVFSSLLRYNIHNIGEAGAHEFGHTVGLQHQAQFKDCTFISQYNPGDGVNAPIMGVAYYVPIGSWWIGPTPYSIDANGCPINAQDDNAILTQKFGLR
jgi:hypothetical protein